MGGPRGEEAKGRVDEREIERHVDLGDEYLCVSNSFEFSFFPFFYLFFSHRKRERERGTCLATDAAEPAIGAMMTNNQRFSSGLGYRRSETTLE